MVSPSASPSSTRRILLVDCDAFFVQVARLEDPQGAGRAEFLVVGGSPSGRGVVTSASYAARDLGVRSAMPTAQALRLCPRATVVPVPRGAVGRWSRRVRTVLEDLAPVVQAASVDEYYLDLTGTERLFGGETLADTAERLRRAVLEKAHITISVGGGSRRLIAKLATKVAKPDGVYIVQPGEEEAFLRTLNLRDISGIGPVLAQELAAKGLVTVDSAWRIRLDWFKRWFGERRGIWIYRRIRALDESEVDPSERRGSISSESTLSSDLDDDRELLRRLLAQSASVSANLRSKSLQARTVTVKIRDYDFKTRQRSCTLAEPVESDAAIYRVAGELFVDLRRRRPVPARLVGVALSGLTEAAAEAPQLDLFAGGGPEGTTVASLDTDTDRRIATVLDQLRARFGNSAPVRGSLVRNDSRAPPRS